MPIQEIYQELKSRLQRLQKTERQQFWLKNLATLASLFFIMAVVFPLFGLAAKENHEFRWLLAGCGLVLISFAIWKYLFRPMYGRSQRSSDFETELALRVGRLKESVRDRFSNALQVYSESGASKVPAASQALAAVALRNVYHEVDNLDFEQIIDRKTPRKRLFYGAGMLLICSFIWSLAPQPMSTGLHALAAPGHKFSGQSFSLEISPGNTEIMKGQSLEVRANASMAARSGDGVVEWQNLASNTSSELIVTPEGGGNSVLQYSHLFDHVRESFAYRFRVSDHVTDWYHVKVLEPPVVRTLQLSVQSPRYTGLPERQLEENIGDLQALPGSRVSVQLRANKDLETAVLNFESGDTVALTIEGMRATGDFEVRQSDHYTIGLQDRQVLANADPIRYRVEVTSDQSPLAQIVVPGRDVDVDESMEVPLLVEAADDFGFSKLRIVYELIPGLAGDTLSGQNELEIANKRAKQIQVSSIWDMTDLNMQPDDVVRYYAEIFDNDYVSGPKSARSETYRIRFPSLYELYEEVASEQEETSEDLFSMYEKAKRIREEIAEVAQQLKKETEVNWEQKQRISESMGATEEMQQDLESVQESLEEMIDTMERNDMLSLETLEKYMELQQLLNEINSPELQQAMKKLEKALENINPKQLEQALENFQFSQEEFSKSIERTLNLLKELQAEQQLDEAIKKTEDLLENQQKLNEKMAGDPGEEERQQMAEQESQLQENAEDLQQGLQDLASLLEELQNEQSEAIQETAEMMERENLSSEMQNASQQMQTGNMQNAQQSGRQAEQTLQQMQEGLQSALQQMRQNRQQEIMNALRRSSFDLLQLSKRQEQLIPESEKLTRNSSEFGTTANQQNEIFSGLQRVTDQLYQASQKSFAITPDIAKSLGQAMHKMEESIRNLEGRNGRSAANSQGQAMQGLDQAVAGLRQSMQAMNGSGSQMGGGMSMEQFLQGLQNLAGQQQGINQQSQQHGDGNKLGPGALGRLAAQQAAVKKSLQQLLEEFGGRDQILGRLDETVNEMEEVVKEMQRQRLTRPTIERQQRILSRMLDAQKSMRERDHSKKRQAETGKKYLARDPGRLPANLGERRAKIQEDLKRALRENYSRDYRELIQKYFEELANQTQEDGEKNN